MDCNNLFYVDCNNLFYVDCKGKPGESLMVRLDDDRDSVYWKMIEIKMHDNKIL